MISHGCVFQRYIVIVLCRLRYSTLIQVIHKPHHTSANNIKIILFCTRQQDIKEKLLIYNHTVFISKQNVSILIIFPIKIALKSKIIHLMTRNHFFILVLFCSNAQIHWLSIDKLI